MTVESLAIDNSASFRKLKDFPVDSNELTFSTSTPHHGKKEQTLPILDLDESNLNNESNLINKHLEIGSSYQIIDFGYSSFNLFCNCLSRLLQYIMCRVEKVKKQGLSLQLSLSCTICEFRYSFWTSKKAEKMRSYDINKRSVYAFRRLGKGYAGMKTFLTIMNLPLPMTKKNYLKIAETIHKAVNTVAESCISDAAKEIKTINSANNTASFDTSVSNDGASQRRGFASMNGNIATISLESGSVIDTEPMSRYCQRCALNYKFKATDPLKYETVLARHENSYMVNHKGSAGARQLLAQNEFSGAPLKSMVYVM